MKQSHKKRIIEIWLTVLLKQKKYSDIEVERIINKVKKRQGIY